MRQHATLDTTVRLDFNRPLPAEGRLDSDTKYFLGLPGARPSPGDGYHRNLYRTVGGESGMRVYAEPESITARVTGLECPEAVFIGRFDPEMKGFHVYSPDADLQGLEIEGYPNPALPRVNLPHVQNVLAYAGFKDAECHVVQMGDQYGLRVNMVTMDEPKKEYMRKMDKFIQAIAP